MIEEQFLLNMFRHHPPNSRVQEITYEEIRERGYYLAMFFNEKVPDSPEKKIAIDKIREAVMWANSAIACNQSASMPTRFNTPPFPPE